MAVRFYADRGCWSRFFDGKEGVIAELKNAYTALDSHVLRLKYHEKESVDHPRIAYAVKLNPFSLCNHYRGLAPKPCAQWK